ncbi:MAG TPA: cytochrome c oxidase subunit II [Stellaceae bacterium]|nr:cytochrome c oxidase subunit II [Stellaceae bacterium]
MALLGKFVSFGRGVRAAWATLSLALFAVPAAWAAEPLPWQMGFQPAASPVRDQIDFLHDDILLPIITVISLFVLGLLLYVIVRYDARRHPTPTKTTHNTVIEVIWTAIPILILLVIFFPSMKLLYYVDRVQKADMTLKVTGRQWYWSYEYPDQNNFSFDSTMLAEDEVGKYGEKRLLGVDKPVVVPVGATVRILVGGSDVIHSWFVPSMGVQEYAVVGRENEAWMKVEKPGTYYGQCNQICGLNHPFMPIEIKAVAKEDFEKWLKQPESLWNVPKKSAGETPATDKTAARIAAR